MQAFILQVSFGLAYISSRYRDCGISNPAIFTAHLSKPCCMSSSQHHANILSCRFFLGSHTSVADAEVAVLVADLLAADKGHTRSLIPKLHCTPPHAHQIPPMALLQHPKVCTVCHDGLLDISCCIDFNKAMFTLLLTCLKDFNNFAACKYLFGLNGLHLYRHMVVQLLIISCIMDKQALILLLALHPRQLTAADFRVQQTRLKVLSSQYHSCEGICWCRCLRHWSRGCLSRHNACL